MFLANPQYAYAIFQSLLMMGLVDPSSLQANNPAPAEVSSEASAVKTEATTDQQKALLMQIMSLTKEQIDSLPPDQRQQILLLKSRLPSQIN